MVYALPLCIIFKFLSRTNVTIATNAPSPSKAPKVKLSLVGCKFSAVLSIGLFISIS